MNKEEQAIYQKGYAAGNKNKKNEELDRFHKDNLDRYERVYLNCLELSLVNCNGWTIKGEKIKDAKGYCDIAKVFADNSISHINLRRE